MATHRFEARLTPKPDEPPGTVARAKCSSNLLIEPRRTGIAPGQPWEARSFRGRPVWSERCLWSDLHREPRCGRIPFGKFV